MNDTRYIKTGAGHTEIQAKALPLTRPMRNLLLLINDSQPASYWLSQIRGIEATDLTHLLAQDLIQAVAGSAAQAAAAPVIAEPSAEDLWTALQQAIGSASYNALYDTLTAQGKAQLGLMRGYRFALEVERCSGQAELQKLALRWVEQLREEHGLAAVRKFADALSSDIRPG
jgi:hypothetical protein